MKAKAGMSLRIPPFVLFDCDGVLIDSEAIACRVEMEVLGEIGHPITAEAFQRRFVGTSRQFSLQALAEDWGKPLPADYVDRVRMRLEESFRTGLRAVEGMPALVSSIGNQCAVASSSSKSRLALTLALTGYDSMFGDRVFSAEQVRAGKPAPDLFLFAAARIGISPHDCVVVEDSAFGVMAARAAGMGVIGFTAGAHCLPGHARMLIEAGADHVAADAITLSGLLGRY
jgi:HAD superfamily hydrolase (TIGR01509 family)